MKRLVLVCLLSLSLVFSLACCAKLYTVKLTDGTEYLTKGEPDFDEDSRAYEFKDLDGKKIKVNRERVESIKEGGQSGVK